MGREGRSKAWDDTAGILPPENERDPAHTGIGERRDKVTPPPPLHGSKEKPKRPHSTGFMQKAGVLLTGSG